jgi:hypothetical protein
MNITLVTQELRGRIDKWDCMKLKRLCTAKEMVIRLKRQPTQWEKIIVSYTFDKGLITRKYWELKKLTSQKINNSMNKWANDLNRQFSKEVQVFNKYKKKPSTSWAIKEMQIKTTLRFYLTAVKMAIINNTNNKYWQEYGGKGTLLHCW